MCEGIAEALWGAKVSPGTISSLNKKAYERIETWRTHPLPGEYPYIYVDGIFLKRSWGGEIENVSILIAIGVGKDGCREIKRRTKATEHFLMARAHECLYALGCVM